MCGITGIHLTDPDPSAHGFVLQMMDAMDHRGPDSAGTFASDDARVWLGFRRLAIRDLDTRAGQPMTSASGRTTIVFNGELYNTDSLARRFCPDVKFHTTSDTEVLLEAIERAGIETVLPECNGMFAVGVFDTTTQVLKLARDRLGMKPLFIYEGQDFVAFGSELRVFHQLGLEPDPCQIEYFLQFGYFPAPRTFYRRITQIHPGEIVKVDRGRVQARIKYFRLSDLKWGTQASIDWDELDTSLTSAVHARLVSDVPLGSFLSGGIDSSLVAARLPRTGAPCPTFTVGFSDANFDESSFASEIANALTIPNHRIEYPDFNVEGLIDDFIDCYEQPFADTSGLPTMLLCRQTRQHVKVALSGDGGDEFFTGYQRYRWYQRLLTAQKSPWYLRKLAERIARSSHPNQKSRIDRIFAARDPAELYAELICAWTAGPISSITDTTDPVASPADLVRETFAEKNLDPITAASYFDAKYYLPDDLQVKVDRASMRVGLEVRCPLMDVDFCRHGAMLSHRTKLKNGLKTVLRHLLRRDLKRELFERPKSGFSAPVSAWLRGPLKDRVGDTFRSRRLHESGWITSSEIGRIWQAHLAGNNQLASSVWMIFMLATYNDHARAHCCHRWPRAAVRKAA